MRFDRANSRFWYRVDDDQWKRAYGLTYMLAHAFWPDYDRNDPVILAGIEALKRQHRAKQRKIQKLKRQMERDGSRARKTAPRVKGTKSTAQVEALAIATPRDSLYGQTRGALIHKQLHVWSMDRYRGSRLFGKAKGVQWPAHRWTEAIMSKLVGMGVDVRYGEYLLYDARVPLGTSIDLVGWSREKQAVVLIEVKTGSKWSREMGNAPMRGRAASVLRLNNSPLNQAVVQLAVTRAVVEGFYGIERTEGLLVWANDRIGADALWLDPRIKTAGRVLVAELHQHLADRGGKAWIKL